VTTIELDTCNCIIEFTDDDDTLITKIIQECKKHTHTIGESFVGCTSQSFNAKLNKKIALSDVLTPQEIQNSINIKDKNFIH